ncbi:MAG: right-handed parallel beta-helix repeat-containing protein [Candidatus Omnitrophota bacterium]|nr:right-handed parallel beta-helix repeat-containing protein [Candidatus Omnitrophota bacterium]
MKKYIITIIITTALFLAATQAAQGAVYYVATTGTDTNPGTQAQPWRTVQKAANTLVAGDICVVNAGSYDERVKAVNSGTADNPITFQVNGNAKVKGFTITNKSYITIQGFEITHEGFTAEPYPGSSSTASILLTSSSNIRIIGNTIHMTEGNGIYFYDLDGPSKASNNVLVKDNVISRCGGLNSSAPYTGIYVYGNYNRVEGNDISHNGEDFIRLTGGNFNVIRNNLLHDNSLSDWPGVHVKEPPHIDGLQNWCASTNGLALYWTLIENNILLNAPSADSHFVIFQDHGNCGSSDIIIRHNTVSNLGDYFLTTGDLVKNIRIYGNTAVNVGIAKTVKDWTDISYVNNATGGKVINNLLYNTVRNGGNEAYADASSSAGFFADYNLGYNSECAGSCIWTNPRPGIGQEPHAVLNKDPLFINAAGDFHLQTNSPAKNAGGPLTHVAVLDPGNGTTLLVDDAGFFQDGWTGIEADWIAIGTADNAAQIKSIDYTNNAIILADTLQRARGDPVWLYKDSSGKTVLYGTAPDIGAYEYVSPYGDISGDGSVTAYDAALALQLNRGELEAALIGQKVAGLL